MTKSSYESTGFRFFKRFWVHRAQLVNIGLSLDRSVEAIQTGTDPVLKARTILGFPITFWVEVS